MTALEQMERIARGEARPPGIAVLLGFTLPEVERGRAVFEMEADERHANPMGTVHGGILCDLADAAMGTAYGTLLEEGETYTTLELKTNFLRPVWKGRLRAEGRLVSSGRTVGLAEARVTDEKGRLVAFATSTLMTLRGEQAAGR
ncbi:MAG TPA: PaaI family thioesterase [Longimicrobiaceae bacterium]|nr:PaaI family thioesterase [Longimicrobiaceae bacterium]